VLADKMKRAAIGSLADLCRAYQDEPGAVRATHPMWIRVVLVP
jgi:hypothetical protein